MLIKTHAVSRLPADTASWNVNVKPEVDALPDEGLMLVGLGKVVTVELDRCTPIQPIRGRRQSANSVGLDQHGD